MLFAETKPHGDATRAAAITKRDDAREGYARLRGLATAAAGTPADHDAADLRDGARERLYAADAWLDYVKRDLMTAWPG